MLGALDDCAIHTHEIRPLERLKSEIVDEIISVIRDHPLKRFMDEIRPGARHRTVSGSIYDFVEEIPHVFADNGAVLIMRVAVFI
jgi:hypothetical protein